MPNITSIMKQIRLGIGILAVSSMLTSCAAMGGALVGGGIGAGIGALAGDHIEGNLGRGHTGGAPFSWWP